MLASKSLCSAGSPLPWAGPQRGIDELQMALSLRRPSHQKSPLKQPGNPQNRKRDGVCDAQKHLKPACWRTQRLREQHMWILTHYILIPFAKLLSEMSSVLSISILEKYDKKKQSLTSQLQNGDESKLWRVACHLRREMCSMSRGFRLCLGNPRSIGC